MEIDEAFAEYENEQQEYWLAFALELDELRGRFGATVVEIAQGLRLSRQRLYSFLHDPSLGLPICRADLLRLWDSLTNPDRLASERLTYEKRLKRQELRQAGPDSLLLSVGFLPSSDPSGVPDLQNRYTRMIAYIPLSNDKGETERMDVGIAFPNSDGSAINLQLQKISFPFDGWIYLEERVDLKESNSFNAS